MSRAFPSLGDPSRLEMGDEENAITQDLLESSDLEHDAEAGGNDGYIETPLVGSQRSNVPEPPEWLSDRHGPFHDIASTRHDTNTNRDNQALQHMRNTTNEDNGRQQPKLSRSFKRPGAARAR